MIEYLSNPSSFFLENKSTCETIEQTFRKLGADCNGYCESSGYGLLTTFNHNGLQWNIEFEKSQTMDTGRTDSYTTFEVFGMEQRNEFALVQSSFFRLFNSKKTKAVLPYPYAFRSNFKPDIELLEELNTLTERFSVIRVQLLPASLKLVLYEINTDHLPYPKELDALIRRWF